MKLCTQIFAHVLVTIALASCGTTRVTFKSEPSGAEVSIKSLSTGKVAILGKTPIATTNKELNQKIASEAPYMIEMNQQNYLPHSVLLTDFSGVDQINVELKLKSISTVNSTEKLNQLAERLFSAQRLAQTKQYKESLDILTDLQKEYPTLAITFELQGGVFYLMGDLQKAYDAYTLSSLYDGQNAETTNMMKKISSEMGKSSTEASIK